jgi:hypothetical protein
MVTRAINDLQAVCIALFLMLVPGSALSQAQKDPVGAQTGKTLDTLNQQKSGASTTSLSGDQVPAAAVASAGTSTAKTMAGPEGTVSYTIKKGDTLWDLSNTFMKDPFLWPFIWKANPAITNPDLIYPGSSLTIPDLAPIERALKAPVGQEQKEELFEKQAADDTQAREGASRETTTGGEGTSALAASNRMQGKSAVRGSMLIMPEEKPVPLVDKYSMLSAGYVDFVDVDKNRDAIVGAPEEGRTIFSPDDVVFVDIRGQENVKIGDKFLIYKPLHKVSHPKTKIPFGRLVRGFGILQITATGSPNILTARIINSFDSIEKGSLLTPYEEPKLIYPSSAKRAKDISGSIMEVTEKRTLTGQMDYVYLDKGTADGIEAGDSFTVYAEHEEPGLPRKMIGEVLVFLVKEHTSTAVVRKSLESVTKGDVVYFKK